MKVEFKFQGGWKGVDALPSRMFASSRSASVQQFDVFRQDVLSISLGQGTAASAQELEAPDPSESKSDTQGRREFCRRQWIALDGKRSRPHQLALTGTVPFVFAEDPFTAARRSRRWPRVSS